jgi:hypothetical protein
MAAEPRPQTEVRSINRKIVKKNKIELVKVLILLFEKSSKYVGVSRNSKRKTPWHARISIDRKLTHLGYFKTEIAAAKHINLVCKKIGMKLKNPGISEEKETILNKEVILKKELSPEKEEEKITWGNFFTT